MLHVLCSNFSVWVCVCVYLNAFDFIFIYPESISSFIALHHHRRRRRRRNGQASLKIFLLHDPQ